MSKNKVKIEKKKDNRKVISNDVHRLSSKDHIKILMN